MSHHKGWTKLSDIKVGDTVEYYLTKPRCTILAISPYKGKYPESFKAVLKLSAPHLDAGSFEIPVNDVVYWG